MPASAIPISTRSLTGRLDLPDLGVDAAGSPRPTSTGSTRSSACTAWTLGERISLILAGDVGGTSTNSQYSAQGVGLIGYRFGLFGQDNANLVVGYRALHQVRGRRRPQQVRLGRHLHGPIAGLTIAF